MSKYIFRVVLLVFGLCLSTSLLARDYTITQITDNNTPDEYPRFNESGDVLWISWLNVADTGWTVFLYDSATKNTHQVSESNVFFDSHQFNNHGDVVWMAIDSNGYTQIHLYNAASQSVTQLTSGDMNQTSPQISDIGDVSWLEQRGTTASNKGVMRYDAESGETAELIFPGASRQGFNTMNGAGDIVWNASVNNASQDVLLYSAATGEIANLSASADALDSNQRLLENGDVLWSSSVFSTPALNLVRHYKAATATITDTEVSGGIIIGPAGHVAWSGTAGDATSTTYTISLYNPEDGKVSVISNETFTVFGVFRPIIQDISARGDVIWTQIVQTDNFHRRYDAPTGVIADITLSAFDYELSDNGDVIYSEWDGNDYEVFTNQAVDASVTQLTDDIVNSGITEDNASGSVLWNRFDPDDNELFVATKNPLSISISVTEVELKSMEEGAKIKLTFVSDNEPDFFENVSVKIDGIALLNTVFGSFDMLTNGKYKFKSSGVKANIDFNIGTMKVSDKNFDPTLVDTSDGLTIEVSFGAATASDHVWLDL